jgi:DNA recombination protein RmuC
VKISRKSETNYAEEIEKLFEKQSELFRTEFASNREEYSKSFREQRRELGEAFETFSKKQIEQFEKLEERLEKNSKTNEERLGKIEERVNTDLKELQNSNEKKLEEIKSALADAMKNQSELFEKFETRLNSLVKQNEEKMSLIEERIETKLKDIRESNEKKLEEMRQTVDEKLHATLEKRLGESFKIVSEQLDNVSKGLGEMRTLATGVGDLKRVLTNVKARGTWGEVQLERLIEEVLTPDQYEKNVPTKAKSNARVEFAIKMPGSEQNKPVWIPVDAKFPIEDYQRLLDALDAANIEEIEKARKDLQTRIKAQAKDIQEKYIDPPNTTNFAIMFLPIEGLYAEVLRIPGLFDFVQREYRVTMTGPTNFLAVLNSLQMGFRTLAIQKRSSEVWKLLGAVKTEFGKFGDLLDKTQEKLRLASDNIDKAAKRSRSIERRLRDVEELPTSESVKMLGETEEE